MKKYLVGLAVALCIPCMANAAVQCLALNEATRCTVYNIIENHFILECDGNIIVRGVTRCKTNKCSLEGGCFQCEYILTRPVSFFTWLILGEGGDFYDLEECEHFCTLQAAEQLANHTAGTWDKALFYIQEEGWQQ